MMPAAGWRQHSGALDLVTFNIHGDGKVWWREGVAGESSQTPRPVIKSQMVKFPAPRHRPYDVMNDTIEANEIPPEKWYPKGHMPELVREWPLTKDIEIPNPVCDSAGVGNPASGCPLGSRRC